MIETFPCSIAAAIEAAQREREREERGGHMDSTWTDSSRGI
jgi:hypothetical protein